MICPAIQLSLPTRDPRLAVPMVDVAGAFAILGDADDSDLALLTESGYLWAWNIAHPDTLADSGRAELRFLAKSVAALKGLWRDCLFSSAPGVRVPVPWHQVLELVLPRHKKPFFTAREIKRSLNCRRQHFINLVASKALLGTTYRQGPGGSPSISRDSYIAFLESRCIGGRPC